MKYYLDSKESVWSWKDGLLNKPRLTFVDLMEVSEYIQLVGNPSRLAFRRGDAETFLDSMGDFKVDGYFEASMKALVSRIKICEAQGDFSLSQKRAKAKEREAKGESGIFPAPDEFTAEQITENPVLRFFHYKHLPEKLQDISREYFRLAQFTASLPRNAERTKALNKLLEAKDCAVRTQVN